MLSAEGRDRFAAEAGRRFRLLTGTVFLPRVTWASLAEPGCGRTLATKLGLFVLVMLAAAGHGIAYSKGRAEMARALAGVSLVGSLGVVLLATALPAT